jgi:quercetin dioxygenase-like cupin family protein
MYHIKRAADQGDWTALSFAGVTLRVLDGDPTTGEATVLTRLAPGATIPKHRHTHADEAVFVVEGDFVEDRISYGPGAYFAGRAGTDHGPHTSKTGCTLLTRFSAALDFIHS